MNTMQCPMGHPPGPQAFCPICGRATVRLPATPRTPEPPAVEPESWPPTEEPTQAFRTDLAPPSTSGSAAAETRRLIEELSGGHPPATGSSWTSAPADAGVFPPEGIPSYAPRLPAEPSSYEDPPYADPPYDVAPDAAPGEPASGGGEHAARRRSRLLPLLLALALLLGGGLLLRSLLSGGDSGSVTTAPVVRHSTAASPSAVTSRYTPAQVAAALTDPHFKHGYDYGRGLARAGSVGDPEAACRTRALRERKTGYAWGAHDRQGCLVGAGG